MPAPADPLLDTIALADGVHAVRLGDGVVILDVCRDVYFCVYDPANTGKDRHSASEELRALLVTQGLAVDTVAGGAAPVPIVTPIWHEMPLDMGPAPGFRAMTRFVRALIAALWRFRRASLAQLLEAASRPLNRPRRSDLAVVAAHFDWLCLWLPLRDQCLFRSFFQLEFYRAHGVSADWVFGVALFPFHAHCWIADGDTLLGERIGKVEGFSVILRVEGAAS